MMHFLMWSLHGHGLEHFAHFPSMQALDISIGVPWPPKVPVWFGWIAAGAVGFVAREAVALFAEKLAMGFLPL